MTVHRVYYLKDLEGRLTPKAVEHLNKQFAKHVLIALSDGRKIHHTKFGVTLREEDGRLYDTVGMIAELCIMAPSSEGASE